MSYYETGGGGGDRTPKLSDKTVILTKNNIPMRFEAGYYNEFTVTTDPTLVKIKKIVYKHHKCSNTQVNDTYEDNNIGTSGAPTCPNITTVNSQTVSTVKGGCYQTPYYYYSIYHPAEPSGYCQQVGYGSRPDVGGSYPIYECSKCHYRQVGGQWHHDCGKPAWTSYHYGTSNGGTVVNTYYLKSCGKTNGQLISADIFY